MKVQPPPVPPLAATRLPPWALARLAKAIGTGEVFFETIEGAGHAGALFETPENLKKVLDFLDGRLK